MMKVRTLKNIKNYGIKLEILLDQYGKTLKLRNMIVIPRSEDIKYYCQVFLDECLYKL